MMKAMLLKKHGRFSEDKAPLELAATFLVAAWSAVNLPTIRELCPPVYPSERHGRAGAVRQPDTSFWRGLVPTRLYLFGQVRAGNHTPSTTANAWSVRDIYENLYWYGSCRF